MGGRRERRVSLWRAGHKACPICLHEFSFERDIQGDLHAKSATIEHVPPRGLSARRYIRVLTCYSCNSRAGETVDHALIDAIKREHSGAIVVDGKRTPVRLSAAAHEPARVTHQKRGGNSGTGTMESANAAPVRITLSHPATSQKVHIWSKSHPLPRLMGKRFTIEWKQRQHSETGLLKSAYLALYALLGRRYARDEAVAGVREEIKNPGSNQLSGFAFNVPILESIVCIAYVSGRSCWAVFLNGTLVLLPGSGDREWKKRRFNTEQLQQIKYRQIAELFDMQRRQRDMAKIPVTDEQMRRGIQTIGPVGWEIKERMENRERRLISVGGSEKTLVAIVIHQNG